MAITVEQLSIVERWRLVKATNRHRLTFDGDDRGRCDARYLAGGLAFATADGECFGAGFPRDALLGVIPDRMLPGDPAVGNAILIERENQREAFSLSGKNRKSGLQGIRLAP